MKHPEREEWIAFFCGESSDESRTCLEEHLQQCPECAQRVEAWRATARQLASWDFPAARAPHQRVWLRPLLNRAAAAAVLVGLGVLIGRWSSPSPDQIRSEVEKSLRGTLAQTVQRQVEDRVRSRVGDAVAAAEKARQQDRDAVLALLAKLRQQQTAEYLSLRADLETVASMTEEQFLQDRKGLLQLAVESDSAKTKIGN